MTTPTERRINLLRGGYSPIPVIGKIPTLKRWQTKTATNKGEIELWEKLFPYAKSDGLLTRKMPTLDIDILNEEASEAVEALIRKRFEERGNILVRIGRAPKRAIPFRTSTPFDKITANLIAPNGDTGQKLELLADGQQVVAFGIHEDTREPYTWHGGEPGQVKCKQLPSINKKEAQQLIDDAAELLIKRHGYRRFTEKKQNKTSPVHGDADEFHVLNQEAMQRFEDWVPKIFDGAYDRGAGKGWRVSSESLGRNLQEDIGFYPDGIVDSGVADQGDPREGKRSPIDIVMEWKFDVSPEDIARREHTVEFEKAVDWLREQLGLDDSIATLTLKPHNFPDEKSIPQWEFLYGRHLLRKTVSATVGMGSTGKTGMSLVEALAMASGKDLLGEQVPDQPLRVLLICLEDNRNAMDKRIAAAMKHYKLKPKDIGGRLFVLAKGELKFKIARLAKGSVKRNTKLIEQIIKILIDKKIDVLSVDPFIKTHGVPENDNNAISDVVEAYDEIAERANCAVSLWHHTRKGNSLGATVDSARGASSFVDACRSVRVLETMTEAEAAKQKIEQHRRYFRAFSGKLNFAPPTDKSNWFCIASVPIMNGPLGHFAADGGNGGDDVGVIEAWELPSTSDVEVTPEQIAAIKAAVKQSEWREDMRASMWVGKAVANVLNIDAEDNKAKLKKLIKKLIGEGELKLIPGRKEDRKPCLFVVAGDHTAAVIELPQKKDDPK